MSGKRGWWRLLALLAVFALVTAACGDDDDDGGGDAAEEGGGDAAGEGEGAAQDCPTEGGESDGELIFGNLLPETGDLAFLGPPEVAGARLAVQDINAAGGAAGDAEVELIEGDSGDTTTDIASQTVDRQLGEGVDAIIGAASSDVSLNVIEAIVAANRIQFSPANTSPVFTDFDDNCLYFRTAPSDVLQGRVLADTIIGDGAESVSLIARQEAYGENLLRFTSDALQEAGATVDEEVLYPPDAEDFGPEVDQLASADSDAYVVIGFDESGQIISDMIAAGIGPDAKALYGSDGNCGSAIADNFPGAAGALEGVRCTYPSAELPEDFQARMLEVDPELVDFIYGPETYDAVTITALAAEVAGTDDPVAVAAEINDVTRGGEECTSFEECKTLIADGGDPDYTGIGGPYEFIDAGEPSAASFAIETFGPENSIDEAQREFAQAEL